MLGMRSLFILLLSIASFPAFADVVVPSGGRVRLVSMATVNPSCQSIGPLTVRVLQRPRVGSLVIDKVLSYPHFSVFNTKSYCNGTLMPHTRVSYQAPRGYVGNDEADVALIDAKGDYHAYHFTIAVMQGLSGAGAIIVPPQPSPQVHVEEPQQRRHHHRVAAVEHAAHVRKHTAPQAQKKHPQQTPLLNI